MAWPDGGVEFNPSHGEWIRLLRKNGFEVLDLIEIQAPPVGDEHYHHVTREWAQRWPAEEIWRAQKRDV